MEIRLAKYIASNGVCSRKQASRLIEAGRVTVGGVIAEHITHVVGSECIEIDGVKLTPISDLNYFIYHKPVGIDCNCNEADPASIVNHVTSEQRIFPVGRIDKDSRGLMLLTNDGALCEQILNPNNEHEKEYAVTVDKALKPNFVNFMEKGVEIDGVKTLPCHVILTGDKSFRIILHQGLNRQIRKMCRELGYKVVDLLRTRMLNLELNDLIKGDKRRISELELAHLKLRLLPAT